MKSTTPPRDRKSPEDRILGLMRIDSWFLGVGLGAVIVGSASLLLLNARGPARGVGVAIVVTSAAVAAVCAVGWAVMNVKEDRAIDRLGDADVIALMDKERWDEAIARLEVQQSSPDQGARIQAWNLLAQCYAATGRNAESEAMIRRSIDARGDSNEDLGEQLVCLGAVVRRQGRTEQAEEIYTRALDLLRNSDPEGTVLALRNVAYLYWSAGNRDKALEIDDRMPTCDTEQLDLLMSVLKPFVEPALPIERR